MTSTEPVVVLNARQKQIIADLSLAALPYEACGLCLGRIERHFRVVEDIIPARNVAANPERHFEVAPKLLFIAHRTAREKGQHVLGHFHSHPNGRKEPSKEDATHAYDVGQLWLIQQMNGDAAGELSAYLAVRSEHWGWPFIALAIRTSAT